MGLIIPSEIDENHKNVVSHPKRNSFCAGSVLSMEGTIYTYGGFLFTKQVSLLFCYSGCFCFYLMVHRSVQKLSLGISTQSF